MFSEQWFCLFFHRADDISFHDEILQVYIKHVYVHQKKFRIFKNVLLFLGFFLFGQEHISLGSIALKNKIPLRAKWHAGQRRRRSWNLPSTSVYLHASRAESNPQLSFSAFHFSSYPWPHVHQDWFFWKLTGGGAARREGGGVQPSVATMGARDGHWGGRRSRAARLLVARAGIGIGGAATSVSPTQRRPRGRNEDGSGDARSEATTIGRRRRVG